MNRKEEIENINTAFTRVDLIIAKGHYKAATKIINKLYNKSLEISYKKGIYQYYNSYLNILFETHENHLAITFLKFLIDNSLTNKKNNLGNYYTKLGITLSRLFDFTSSFYYLQKGLEINVNNLPINIDNIISSYLGLAENAFRQNDYVKSNEYVKLGFEYLYKKKNNDLNNDYSYFYLSIYKIRFLIKEYQLSKAKEELELLKNNISLHSKINVVRYKELELEIFIKEKGDYDLIVQKAQYVLKLSIELENKNLRKRILKMLENFHRRKKEYTIAYKYSNQLIKTIEREKKRNVPVLGLKNIGLPNEIIKKENSEFEIYLKSDIKIALDFQKNFYNTNYNENLEVDIMFKPSKNISGDYIGTFSLDKQNNYYLFVLADTVGKGIAASYLSFMLDGIIKSIIYNTDSFQLKKIIKDINTILADTFKEQGFVSLWAGIVDITNKKIESINAGHLPTFFITENNKVLELNKGTTILGMFKELYILESEIINFNENCCIIAYSDGVTETINDIDTQYEQNFEKLVNYYAKDRSINFIKHLETDLNLFKDYSKEQDDVSCMIIEYKKMQN